MGFVPGKSLVHVSGQVVGQEEADALAELGRDLVTGRATLAAGRRALALERGLAKRFNVKHALLVNSGSSANLLAFQSLNLPPGSRVLTVACAFPTTVAPIVQAGCIPVFVDVGPDGNVDPRAFLDVLDRAPTDPRHPNAIRAIVLAHALGFPFDLDVVRGAACGHPGQEPIPLLADCCDAYGATWHGEQVTKLADVSTMSMYPAHGISMGQGGCVLTDSDVIAEEVRCLRDWGRRCVCAPGHDNTCGRRFDQPRENLGSLPAGWDDKYLYRRLGYNFAVSEMQAAIGLVQIDKLDGFIERRRATWGFYREAMIGIAGLDLPNDYLDPAETSPFGFLVTVKPDAPFTRDWIVRELEKRRIQTRPLFAGNILRHPCIDRVSYEVVGGGGRDGMSLPNTDQLMRNSFWIGVYPGVTDEMREYVVEVLHEAAK